MTTRYRFYPIRVRSELVNPFKKNSYSKKNEAPRRSVRFRSDTKEPSSDEEELETDFLDTPSQAKKSTSSTSKEEINRRSWLRYTNCIICMQYKQ